MSEARLDAEATPTAPRRRELVTLAIRLAVSLGAAAAICLVVFSSVPRTYSGLTTIVGYPLFADFNVNRYLDAYYLVAFAFPFIVITFYLGIARVGPLRRRSPARRIGASGPIPSIFDDAADPTGSHSLRAAVVGATVALTAIIAADPTGTSLWVIVAIGAVGWALVCSTFGLATRHLHRWHLDASWLNLLGALSVLPLLAVCSSGTEMVVTSTHRVVHYSWFPIPVAVVVTLLAVGVSVRSALRRGAAETERRLVTYLVVPVAMFCCLCALPGALGPMDVFTEGEYLAGGWLMLHGALPWRDLYQIHGVLDDGLKPILGFEIFGPTRWGATAGITMFFYPAYWVSFYLFAAMLFRRRAMLIGAATLAMLGGILVDWDVRYLCWPLVMIAFASVVRSPSRRALGVLGFALVAEAVLVPELSFAIPALVAVLICVDVVERKERRVHRSDFRRSLGTVFAGLGFGVAFAAFLTAIGGLSGFVGYFQDFTSGHATNGGIPLYTNYAVPGHKSALGVITFATTHPGFFDRYVIELWLPLALALIVIASVVVAIRRGRRPRVEHWIGLGAAAMELLYFQKAPSRADTAHIGEVFAVGMPLLLSVAALGLGAIERTWRLVLDRITRSLRALRLSRLLGAGGTQIGVVALVLVAVLSPASLTAIPSHQAGALRPSTSVPAPAALDAAAGGLGYESGALDPTLVPDLSKLLDKTIGPSAPVFDFSGAPGLVDFLLGRRPGTRFYDISLAVTTTAQDSLISDLETSRPRIVIWSGVGLSSWDFLENEVREYLVASYVLAHYRPLARVDGEIVLIDDGDSKAPSVAVSERLDDTASACAWGDAANFLAAPAATTAPALLELETVASSKSSTLYEIFLPPGIADAYSGLVVVRSDARAAASITVSNTLGPGRQNLRRHDITFVALASRAIVSVDVGACLQWQSVTDHLYLRYVGPGGVSAVSLYRS